MLREEIITFEVCRLAEIKAENICVEKKCFGAVCGGTMCGLR